MSARQAGASSLPSAPLFPAVGANRHHGIWGSSHSAECHASGTSRPRGTRARPCSPGTRPTRSNGLLAGWIGARTGEVVATDEYSAIRPYLANASGFQGAQYRCIEFALGNKNMAMIKPQEHRADLLAQVRAAYEAPSLYDDALRLLARRGKHGRRVLPAQEAGRGAVPRDLAPAHRSSQRPPYSQGRSSIDSPPARMARLRARRSGPAAWKIQPLRRDRACTRAQRCQRLRA